MLFDFDHERIAMDRDKETKKKLLSCAMKEFSEKGYMKASLRNICKEAGVTTGALYFFFKDKEDLFASLVGEPLKKLEKMLIVHFIEEVAASKELKEKSLDLTRAALQAGFKDDMEMAQNVISFLFENKQAFDLLLTRAQGSAYENLPDHMVDLVEGHYSKMYAAMKGYKSTRNLTKEDKFIIHWMSHDQIDIFIHILTHCKDEKEAERQLRNMMAYMIGGWMAVLDLD